MAPFKFSKWVGFMSELYVTAGFINTKVFLYHVTGHKLCRTTNTMGIDFTVFLILTNQVLFTQLVFKVL